MHLSFSTPALPCIRGDEDDRDIEIRTLRQQVEDLKYQIKLLKHEERLKVVNHKLFEFLSWQEMDLFNMLFEADGKIVRKSALHAIICPDAQIKLIDVLICNIRKKLKENNVSVDIKTEWGVGFSLTKESISFLKTRISEAARAA